MEFIWEGISTAFRLIISLDREVFEIVIFTLYIGLIGILISSLMGIPIGLFLFQKKFPGRQFFLVILNTLMALPTVVVGLTLFSILSKKGPLGNLGLLFSPGAIILGQVLLVTPLITGISFNAFQSIDKRAIWTAKSLGANGFQVSLIILKEAKSMLLLSVVAGFGRVISEVGAAMMLGGNIKGYTRTITTAIALETGKGNFSLGIALGIILMFLAFLVNSFLTNLQKQRY
ncbi:MAG: ABC transporter permease [Acidobacteriota bacterium]